MESRQRRSGKNNNTKNKKNKTRKKVVLAIVIILLFIISAAGTYTFMQLSKIQSNKISKSNEDLGINSDLSKKLKENNLEDNAVNIAFFGLDKRDKNEPGRSDSIIVVTIDKKYNKIKLSSIMRDSYVSIKGHGQDKLTHAYAFGGPQLAIRTLNENFNLNIKDYVAIDFYNMESVIDALGGVTIDIKSGELNAVNGMMTELAQLGHYQAPYLTKAGAQTLNGKQALAYTRTRYVGNGDFERTDRQRTVLNAIFNKIQQAGPAQYPYYISKLLPFVETSMSKTQMLGLATTVTTSGIKTLDQVRFPVDGYCDAATINGVWYLKADLKATGDQLYKYIYEDVKPTPGTPKF